MPKFAERHAPKQKLLRTRITDEAREAGHEAAKRMCMEAVKDPEVKKAVSDENQFLKFEEWCSAEPKTIGSLLELVRQKHNAYGEPSRSEIDPVRKLVRDYYSTYLDAVCSSLDVENPLAKSTSAVRSQ